jgi:hypothetical protein
MGVNSTNLGLLKEVYDDNTIQTIINEEAPTFEALQKGTEDYGESGVLLPVRYRGNQRGQGSQNELENFRTPAQQKMDKWAISAKMFVHHIQISDLAIQISKKNKQSYAKGLTFQTDNGFKDSIKELNAQHYRDGSGRIAQVNGAVVNNDTVTFDNGIPTHFKIGTFVDVVTGADVKEADSQEIINVDIPNNQIVLANNITCSDDSYIVREDVRDNVPTGGKELSGFVLGTDDGTLSATFQGLNRTTNNTLDGITIDAGGANLSADIMQRALVRMKTLGGSNSKETLKVFLNPVQMRKYFQITTIMKEYKNDARVDAGHKQVPTWNGYGLTEDSDCGFDSVFIIDTSDYKKYFVNKGLHIMNEDGNEMRQLSNQAVYGLQIGTYMNLGMKNPTSHARIHNLAQPTW